MSTFTTNLRLGDKAWVVTGDIDHYAVEMTVGSVRVSETLWKFRLWHGDPVYKEEYMCEETGVGSGSVYTYFKNIFKTKQDAQIGIREADCAAYKRRLERDAQQAEYRTRCEQEDRQRLAELKAKYETTKP